VREILAFEVSQSVLHARLSHVFPLRAGVGTCTIAEAGGAASFPGGGA
jgi:hypothetical protein